MTEQEAAARLCALLNEIQAAGYQVGISERSDRGALYVGEYMSVLEPFFDDAVWEAEEDR